MGTEALEVDVAVVGAGVVGLAVARALARAGREVFVLEAEGGPGRHTSGRNSGVIHAGLYYPVGSLKARLCVEGRRLLYDYCAEKGVPHARLGKIVVATREAELPEIEAIAARGRACGVTDLQPLDRAGVAALEPEVTAVGGFLSPSTGIVDPEALVRALLRDVEEAGVTVVFNSPVRCGSVDGNGLVVEVGGPEPVSLRCRSLVNAAGLHAQALSRSLAGVPPATVPPTHYAKGNYFVLSGKVPFRRLVYPVPVPGGLGTHLTLDLGGGARFGPDVEWVERVEYSVDERRAGSFETAVARWWPALPRGALQPGFCGVRPKITPPGAPAADFVVQGAADHGIRGFVALYGIESPGLTASLALAEHVKAKLAPA
jgi:L-2-hydroxyglutarate oxidase LhgO